MKRTSLSAALVLATGLALAPPASAAVDAFLHLDGIEGESTDLKHKGWIEVSSFQLEQVRSAATTIGSATGGAGAGKASEGKVSVHDISITKRVDKSTPSLFQHCANGKHIPNGQISMRKAGGTQQEYFVIKLTDIIVSSYRTVGGGAGGAGGTETFTLNAGNATVEYTGAPTSPDRSAHLAPGAVALAASTPTPTPKPGQGPATLKR